MGSVKIRGTVTEGAGPYLYKFEAFNACGEITFTDEDGNSSVDEITVSDDNPYTDVTVTFNDDDCSVSEILALFRLTVTSETDETCNAIAEINKPNPCYNFRVGITTSSVVNGQQVLTGVPSGGNAPFTYSWTVRSGNITIDGSGSMVTVNRLDESAATIRLTTTDANGCVTVTDGSLPAVNVNPVLLDATYQFRCGSNEQIIDIVQLGSDADGSLDLSTITVVQDGAQGSSVVDPVLGRVTYTAGGGATGTDTVKLRVSDNNGNVSNDAFISIIITPCADDPVALVDNVATDCNTVLVISPTLNDTDSDGTIDANSLAIVSEPVHGTAVLLTNGQIQYTPPTNYDGPDVIRYTVNDNDGNTSNVGVINITVNTCCDVHTADFDIDCDLTGSVVTFSALSTGSAPNQTSDVMEVSTTGTGGYAPGSSTVLSYTCGITNNAYSGGALNLGPAGSMTTTNIGANLYKVRHIFATAISAAEALTLETFFNLCEGQVLRFNFDFSGVPQPNRSFLSSRMTNLQVTTNYIEFDYTNLPFSGICEGNINAEVASNHTYLGGVVGTDVIANVEMTGLACLIYGDPDHEIWFKRTIQRTGCPDLILEKKVQVRKIWNLCDPAAYIVSLLQGSAGNANNDGNALAFSVGLNLGVANAVSQINVLGMGNILTQPYPLTAGGATDLETFLDTYLSQNGGGDASVVLATEQIIIQIVATQQTFSNIFLSDGTNSAFTLVQ